MTAYTLSATLYPQLMLAEQLDPYTIPLTHDIRRLTGVIGLITSSIEIGIAARQPAMIDSIRELAADTLRDTCHPFTLGPLHIAHTYLNAFWHRAAGTSEAPGVRPAIADGHRMLLKKFTLDGEPKPHMSGLAAEVAALALLRSHDSYPSLPREGHGPYGVNHDVYKLCRTPAGPVKIPGEVKYTKKTGPAILTRHVAMVHVGRFAAAQIGADDFVRRIYAAEEPRILQGEVLIRRRGAFRLLARALMREETDELTSADAWLIQAVGHMLTQRLDLFGKGLLLDQACYLPKPSLVRQYPRVQ